MINYALGVYAVCIKKHGRNVVERKREIINVICHDRLIRANCNYILVSAKSHQAQKSHKVIRGEPRETLQ